MRKYYLDNMKWSIILLVLAFHTVCIFSSCKAPMSFNAPGIPVLDSIGYLVYPWFMSCMFAAAGISAKFALEKRSRKSFAKERIKKLLIPFITYLILIGPFASALAFNTGNLDKAFSKLPPFVVALIRVVSGMGPAWFLIQLFLISMIFLLIHKLDKKQKLLQLGSKTNILILLLLYFPVLLSAQLLYEFLTFCNVLYLFMFLLGYYVFSHDKVILILQKYALLLLFTGLGLGIVQTYFCWGKVYQAVVNNWLVMLYTWIMILAVFGCFARFFDSCTGFTAKISGLSFGIYLFHYVPMVYIAYFLVTKLNLPYILNYVIVFAGSLAAAVLLTAAVKKMPVLNFLFALKPKKEASPALASKAQTVLK